jgi:Lhr-like helicase
VIVDEIHAVAGSKRGSHLALSLERLAALTSPHALTRIGLSATQKPIEEIARFCSSDVWTRTTTRLRGYRQRSHPRA